jgi:hypothetical protein
MSGSIPPLPHIPSWHAQGQPDFLLYVVDTCAADILIAGKMKITVFSDQKKMLFSGFI